MPACWQPPKDFRAAEKRAWIELFGVIHAQGLMLSASPQALEAAATQLARAREARKWPRRS